MMAKIEIIDLLDVASFLLAVENLDQNLTQNDKAELQSDLTDKMRIILKEIHAHLELQDTKLNYIIERIERDDRRRNILKDGTTDDRRHDVSRSDGRLL